MNKKDLQKYVPFLAGMAALAIIGVAAWVLFRPPSITETESETRQVPRSSGFVNPEVDKLVTQVAAQFVCVCGGCENDPVSVCQCERAVEERAFIRDQLARGFSVATVVAGVKDVYGGYAAEMAPDDEALPSQAKAVEGDGGNGNLASARPEGVANLAAAADRNHIISHFRCPCGQCEMDALAECDCQHPNGAVKVKEFVDQQIAAGRYSMAEIVEMVDQKYGGRIH